MRIAVIGTSGSGKTTLARALAAQLKLPFVELDAINWQAGWRDLNTHDPEEFKRRVAEAIAPDAWVADGVYTSSAGALVRARATHLIWLDYPHRVIMRRVLWRSLKRSITREELWPGTGNRELFARWRDKDHPLRWAWKTHRSRRPKYEAMLRAPENAHLKVLRLRTPQEAKDVVKQLGAYT